MFLKFSRGNLLVRKCTEGPTYHFGVYTKVSCLGQKIYDTHKHILYYQEPMSQRRSMQLTQPYRVPSQSKFIIINRQLTLNSFHIWKVFWPRY